MSVRTFRRPSDAVITSRIESIDDCGISSLKRAESNGPHNHERDRTALGLRKKKRCPPRGDPSQRNPRRLTAWPPFPRDLSLVSTQLCRTRDQTHRISAICADASTGVDEQEGERDARLFFSSSSRLYSIWIAVWMPVGCPVIVTSCRGLLRQITPGARRRNEAPRLTRSFGPPPGAGSPGSLILI